MYVGAGYECVSQNAYIKVGSKSELCESGKAETDESDVAA